MAKNGLCIGPPGARIHHERCVSERCDCPCHLDTDRLILSGIPVESGTQSGPRPDVGASGSSRGLADDRSVD